MTHTILAHILSLLTLVVAPAAADEVGAHAGHHGKRAGLCERLECTDDQRAQIDSIRDAHRQDAADERAEAKRLHDALKAERKKAEPNAEEIARLQASLDAIKASIRRDREASKAEIAALLTPEQRAELDAMKAERKKGGKKGGKGKAHAKRDGKGKGGKGKAHAKRERGPEGKGKGKAHAKRARGGRDASLAG